jgi:coenzyme F420-0:L-glutamate ligase / coenzyme F420-1:gamma-L-glutamate ligase
MDGELAQKQAKAGVSCARELSFHALLGLPRIAAGDDLGALLCAALAQHGPAPLPCDVLVVTSKVVSKAEDRWVDLQRVAPSEQALALAERVGQDARAIEVILWDSERISRAARGALIVRHHGGHVSANAGLDFSNAQPSSAANGGGPWLLRLPADPDASAARLRAQLERHFGMTLGVIISDSFGRPFRQGSVGTAVGVAGLPALHDQRGAPDLDGRLMEHTISATADQLAAAADLVCGQADEGRAAALVRGLRFEPATSSARELCRPADGDLYL